MKKFLAVAMAFVLALSMAALAEEIRERTVTVAGAEETVSETRFVSTAGYALWYPAELLQVQQDDVNDCFYPIGSAEEAECTMQIVPVEIDPAEGELFFAEATGGYGEESVIGEMTTDVLDNGDALLRVEVTTGEFIDCFYMIKGESSVLCITASYPAEAAETYGARFETMVRTIEY